MKKIEQTKENMCEIYKEIIYPGFGCAAVLDMEIKKLEILRDSIVKESANKSLNRVLAHGLDSVIKEIEQVINSLEGTMETAIMSFAPMEFVVEMQANQQRKNSQS